MQVRILLFGVLKELLRREQELIDLPPQATVGRLLDALRARSADSGLVPEALWPSLAVAVNQRYAPASQILQEGDEVALLPPVSGGLSEGAAISADPLTDAQPTISLTRDPIDGEALTELLKAPEDGAVVIFDGVVRNNTRGRRTLYLDYEAYEAMALDQMRQLVGQARERFAIRAVLLVHRLGRLEIGESSVWIGVASAHRAAAFDACRYLIDVLKRTVPIWKKEHFEDGAVWADGEPFPPEIAPPAAADSGPAAHAGSVPAERP